jgi:hypothetical protein
MSEWKQGAAKRRDARATKSDLPTKRQRRKKDTKKWCKGVEGREHQPLVTEEDAWNGKVWRIRHICPRCRKILKEEYPILKGWRVSP